ncbi:MAG: alpha/beta fold hydrolase [Flavobacteriaceae bacterium]|nr:alpha/beta fold hydrolase [Flavobacteriaceae bacterium]
MELLHSRIIGEGQPFIILHGFLGMGDNWKSLAKKFSELGYQLHLVDQRNHGRSFHDPNFNYTLLSEDLKKYCAYHQLEDIVLLGHSMGGKTAMEFATTYPNMVKQLIIADIAPKSYPSHHQDILKALSSLDFSEIKTRGQAENVLSTYIKDTGTRLFLLKNLFWKEKGQLGLRINLSVLIEAIDEIGKALPLDRTYPGLTLFVRGETSGYVEQMDELAINQQFPESQITTIVGAGHWLHADNPVSFFEEVSHFLNQN